MTEQSLQKGLFIKLLNFFIVFTIREISKMYISTSRNLFCILEEKMPKIFDIGTGIPEWHCQMVLHHLNSNNKVAQRNYF